VSVNVDFDIRVSGFVDKKAVAPIEDYLSGEGLLDDLEKTVGKTDVRFSSDIAIIISRSYVYLTQLAKELGKLAKTNRLVIEFRTRVDGDAWSVEHLPKGTKMAKTKEPKIEPKARAQTKLSVNGKTCVITGTVTGMQRKDAEAKLEGLGAKCTGSVSKKTDYVFAMADAGSKKGEAERLGIPVLSEAVLFSLIGSPGSAAKTPKKPVTAEAKAKVASRKAETSDGSFDGKTVVITGTLSMQRSEAAEMLEAAGAKVVGSVSANTHYLVTGAGVGASKLSKATALGVTIIDEAKMNEMLGD